MLSDEEKQAIEYLKRHIIPCYGRKGTIEFMLNDTLLNLIEKQFKEIEHQKEKRENQKKELAILNAKQIEFNKLVNIVNSYKGQFKRQQKEIEELTDKNKKLQDKAKELIFEKQELTSALLDSTPNDKIKAKIDEVDKDENASIPDFIEYAKEYATQKLQSLLEKEGE